MANKRIRGLKNIWYPSFPDLLGNKKDDLIRSLLGRHPGESQGPEHLEITGFRRLPRTRSGVRRNDGKRDFRTVYENLKKMIS
jgi:hypothetical protein